MPYEPQQDAHAKMENPHLHSRMQFPKILYPLEAGRPRIVRNESEEASALQNGFRHGLMPGHIIDEDGNCGTPKQAQIKAEEKLDRIMNAFASRDLMAAPPTLAPAVASPEQAAEFEEFLAFKAAKAKAAESSVEQAEEPESEDKPRRGRPPLKN